MDMQRFVKEGTRVSCKSYRKFFTQFYLISLIVNSKVNDRNDEFSLSSTIIFVENSESTSWGTVPLAYTFPIFMHKIVINLTYFQSSHHRQLPSHYPIVLSTPTTTFAQPLHHARQPSSDHQVRRLHAHVSFSFLAFHLFVLVGSIYRGFTEEGK